MKTGAVLAFSVEAGAIIGRAGPDEQRRLHGFGQALGAAFQIADDLLDREASPESLGKRTGKDRERGKATLVDVLGSDGARRDCERLIDEALAHLTGFGKSADLLREAARFTGARRS
jgi:farnesyl diphosphate synthase